MQLKVIFAATLYKATYVAAKKSHKKNLRFPKAFEFTDVDALSYMYMYAPLLETCQQRFHSGTV